MDDKTSLLRLVFSNQVYPYRGSTQRDTRDCLRQQFLKTASRWTLYKTASPFNRRVTALQWHPTYPDVVAVGSHGGDILLWRYERSSAATEPQIKGVGMGYGSITDMKFHPHNPTGIYTTAVDGRFCLQDFSGRHSEVFLDTMDICNWWCSFDISREHNVIFVGDSCGGAVLLDSDGQRIGKYKRLHKGKIKHSEFCPARSWMLATTSLDKTMALWDIRMLKDHCNIGRSSGKHPEPLSVMVHNAPVSSAYFDPVYGSRILTTSQNGEIRVYDAYNYWEQPTITLEHSHRFFQRMTEIKATWHPLYNDLCVVGRYPRKEDVDQSRTIDLIDLQSGERVAYFYSPYTSYIIQRNKFNSRGDSLASGMGYSAAVWKAPEDMESVLELARNEAARSKQRRAVQLPRGGGGASRSTPKRKRERKEDQAALKKKKMMSVCSRKKK